MPEDDNVALEFYVQWLNTDHVLVRAASKEDISLLDAGEKTDLPNAKETRDFDQKLPE